MAQQNGGTPPAAKEPTKQGLKYVGIAGVRKISKADWAKAKIENQDAVEWNAENDFVVPLSDLNEKAQAVLAKDPGFKTVEVKD